MRDTILRRVKSEYAEMPGLGLTIRQASRLWALDGDVCRGVLEELVASGFLSRGGDGRYRRTSSDPVRGAHTRVAKADLPISPRGRRKDVA